MRLEKQEYIQAWKYTYPHMCAMIHTQNEDVEIIKKELIRSSVVEMYLANFTQEMWMDKKKITDYEDKVN